MSAQFTPAAQHPQALLQRGPRQLQSGSVMASAAPFFPGSDVAGELLILSQPQVNKLTQSPSEFHAGVAPSQFTSGSTFVIAAS